MRSLTLALAFLSLSAAAAPVRPAQTLPLCEDVGVALPFAIECETDEECETEEMVQRAAFCAANPEHAYCHCR